MSALLGKILLLSAVAAVVVSTAVVEARERDERAKSRRTSHNVNSPEQEFIQTYGGLNWYQEGQVDLQYSIYVMSLTVDESRRAIELMVYHKLKWNDTRLANDPQFAEIANGEELRFPGASSDLEMFNPPVFYDKALEVRTIDEPMMNRGATVSPTGEIFMAQKLLITVLCPEMSNGRDTFRCEVALSSFWLKVEALTLAFMDGSRPYALAEEIVIPGYTLGDIIVEDCTEEYTAGSWACIQGVYVFSRE